MVENVLGMLQVPFAVATNFTINGRDVVVPMAVEEPSVVAAASFGAKLARSAGGFRARAPPPMMVGQVLLVNVPSGAVDAAVASVRGAAPRLVELANQLHPSLRLRGGGVLRIEPRALETWRGMMLVVDVHVDVRDSMGANTVTTICEKLAPHLEDATGATARMRILSNLCPERVFEAEAVWTKQELVASVKGLGLTGEEVVDAMLDASAFAEADPFRACTHNKGMQVHKRWPWRSCCARDSRPSPVATARAHRVGGCRHHERHRQRSTRDHERLPRDRERRACLCGHRGWGGGGLCATDTLRQDRGGTPARHHPRATGARRARYAHLLAECASAPGLCGSRFWDLRG